MMNGSFKVLHCVQAKHTHVSAETRCDATTTSTVSADVQHALEAIDEALQCHGGWHCPVGSFAAAHYATLVLFNVQ